MPTCPFCLRQVAPPATVCPHCLTAFDAPPRPHFSESETPRPPASSLTGRIGVWLASGLVIASLGMLLMPVIELLPGMKSGRSAGPRSTSRNNLRQIGLAFLNYHDAVATLPPGSVVDGSGRAHHGWQAMLLPYLDAVSIHQQIDFHKPWDDPANAAPFQTTLSVSLIPKVNPMTLPSGYGLSHYAGNSHVLFENSSVSLSDVRDGESHTLLAGEVATEFKAWGDPSNIRDPALGINTHPQGFGSPFEGGAHFLLLDGSVRFISDKIDPHVLHALATPAGGETVGDF